MTKATPILYESAPLGIYTRGGCYSPTPFGLPSEVRVSGDPWAVIYHSRIYLAASARRPLLGVALCQRRILVADPTPDRFEVLDTVLHEYAHAVCWAGRQTDSRLAKMSKDVEEGIAELFARELTRGGRFW